jgi:hypothetical protein
VIDIDHQDRGCGCDLCGSQILVAVIERPPAPEVGQRVPKRDLLEYERAPRVPPDGIGRRGGRLRHASLQSVGHAGAGAWRAPKADAAMGDRERQFTWRPGPHGTIDVLEELRRIRSVKDTGLLA